jgi:hypothetical protein
MGKLYLEVQLKSLNTVLEMAKINTRAKPKRAHFPFHSNTKFTAAKAICCQFIEND